MPRKDSSLKMNHSPLVFVLCQVRFSIVRSMSKYIPEIQDRLRKDFPIDASTAVQMILPNTGGAAESFHRWEFQTQDRTSSIVVTDNFVTYQTTKYDTFETFLEGLILAIDTVSDVVKDVYVDRIGLRYVNVIRPKPDETWTQYFANGLHGFTSSHTRDELRFYQTMASTDHGRLLVRMLQNRDQQFLPPDLTNGGLKLRDDLTAKGDRTELISILDLDHFKEERGEKQCYSQNALEEIVWNLKDTIWSVFSERLITDHAKGVWQ